MQKHPSPAGQGNERVFLCPVTGPAAVCKKPYFCPPGVSVLNKKKEGRCTHIWCSCHLNLFQHLCIIFLLSGTRAFQMSLRRPIWDAFSVIPYKRDAAECAAALPGYSPENRKKDGKVYGKFHGAKRASGPLWPNLKLLQDTCDDTGCLDDFLA